MADAPWDIATQLAILSGGRELSWDAPGDTELPDSGADGIDLSAAIRAVVHVRLRTQAHTRTAVVTVSATDLTATYRVTLNGTDYDYDANAAGAADTDDIVAGIQAAVDAATGYSASADTDDDTITITSDSEIAYGVEVTATGSGGLTCSADAVSARVRVWALWREAASSTDDAPSSWSELRDKARNVDNNTALPLCTGGINRLHVQLDDVSGHPLDGSTTTLTSSVAIGRGVTESA